MDKLTANELRRKALVYSVATDIVSTAINSLGAAAVLSSTNKTDYSMLVHNAIMAAWKKKGAN